jgi:hypothetical protein
MSEQEAKVEFLKVWYSLFCTVMDAWSDGEYNDSAAVVKLRDLRNALTTRLPEVEASILERRKKGEL